MDGRAFFIVTATARSGVITYQCPTPEWALRKATDFVKAEYKNISITAPDGRALSEADLARVVAGYTEPDLTTETTMMSHSD